MTRLTALLLAYFFVALAIIGVFLPVFPTVPFLLLAAWFSAKGSKRLNKWLYEHTKFGSALKNWEQQGAVSRRTKLMTILTFCGSWAFLLHFLENTWVFVGISVTYLIVSIYITTRQSRVECKATTPPKLHKTTLFIFLLIMH